MTSECCPKAAPGFTTHMWLMQGICAFCGMDMPYKTRATLIEASFFRAYGTDLPPHAVKVLRVLRGEPTDL